MKNQSGKNYFSMRIFSLFYLLFCFCLSSPIWAITEEEKVVEAIEKVKPSVVNIQIVGKNEAGNQVTGSGSGVVLPDTNYILTNYHVIRYAQNIIVTVSNGKKYHAIVHGESKKNDLAVLKVNAEGLRAVKWGNSKKLKIGQVAIAIGNPYKFDWSVSRGIISALNRNISASGVRYVELIQTDAAINRGNSGGALIDANGRVIGINTLVYRGENKGEAEGIGFAIPAHRAKIIAERLIAKQVYYSAEVWIGVSGMTVTQEMAEANLLPINCGVLVTAVQPVSPAEKAGIRKGDIITLANGKLVANLAAFKQFLSGMTPGDDLELVIWRGDKQIKLYMKVSQKSYKP